MLLVPKSKQKQVMGFRILWNNLIEKLELYEAKLIWKIRSRLTL